MSKFQVDILNGYWDIMVKQFPHFVTLLTVTRYSLLISVIPLTRKIYLDNKKLFWN